MNTTHSRRGLLAAFGAISVVSIGATATAVACAQPGENPELILFGEQFRGAESDLKSATEWKRLARAHYDRLAPEVPEDLILKDLKRNWQAGDLETDIEGEPVYLDGAVQRKITTVKWLTALKDEYGFRRGSMVGKFVHKTLPIAERYEAAVEQAKTDSGIEAAVDDHRDVLARLTVLAGKIGQAEARTKTGILIKANALTSVTQLSEPNRHWASVMIGPGLAQAIVSLHS